MPSRRQVVLTAWNGSPAAYGLECVQGVCRLRRFDTRAPLLHAQTVELVVAGDPVRVVRVELARGYFALDAGLRAALGLVSGRPLEDLAGRLEVRVLAQ